MSRLRVFVGPNGSGKSSLVKKIRDEHGVRIGFFVNADQIELAIKTVGYYDFQQLGLAIHQDEFVSFFKASSLNEKLDQMQAETDLKFQKSKVFVDKRFHNSYVAALFADFARNQLLKTGNTFSFESVFSDKRKLEFLENARSSGYRIYLYFVTTNDSSINVERVKQRVLAGGHAVDRQKIIDRYHRCMNLLFDIISISDRAFLFDNSNQMEFVCEVKDGTYFELASDEIPFWLHELLSR
jgi:predicted ABC-type ATPase